MTADAARIDFASVFLPACGPWTICSAQSTRPDRAAAARAREIAAPQINGCAYCLDMHSKDARALGESEQRLHLLAACGEASCYDARERAALAWGEDLT